MVAEPPPPVFVIVMPPEELLTDIPDPALSVARLKPEPLPINNCPLLGTVAAYADLDDG